MRRRRRRSTGGRSTLVVSAGVDLDLVPFATDARLATGDPTRIVVPARDALPVQADIAALLRRADAGRSRRLRP